MTPSGPSVAIVGIGGIFPDAPDLDSFWNCIRDGHSAARIVPDGRWQLPADEAFSPEVGAADRVYSRTGCFIEELPPASTLPGLAIDPTALEGLDPLFHLLIHAGKRAFDDGITAQLDRSRVGVIIGNLALPSETSATLTRNWLGRTFEEQLLGDSSTPSATSPLPLNNGTSAFTSSFPAENTQETTPNALNRYVAGLPAGILAQALGLGGGNVTLDAACASSLYAIKLAVDELLSGRVDAMLSGGVSRPVQIRSLPRWVSPSCAPSPSGGSAPPSTPPATAWWSAKAPACSCSSAQRTPLLTATGSTASSGA
jgi:acyl transferase domain-containing protein